MRLLPSRERAVDVAGERPLKDPLDVLRLLLGDAMLSPAVAKRVIAMITGADADKAAAARARLAALTEREHDVALALARGGSNATIATELSMSVATVKSYVSRLLQGLGLENRVQVALLVRDAQDR